MTEDRLTPEELAAEGATALPQKEVLSLLDLNANLDLALDAAAPIDLAVGANANIAAPINAAVGANVLSPLAAGEAGGSQAAEIHQGIVGNATATSPQHSTITQGDPTAGTGTGGTAGTGGTGTPGAVSSGNLSDGNLLDVNVNLNGDLHLAAPIDGAVAANANAAAPINAAVDANIGSPGAESVAVANQQALIDQSIQGDASATADQVSGINQGPSSTP
ncbi:MAG: hypothetical protein JO222_00965 [Frankiales bacterium]|nr:hypothetical protein [Frankiales bacterium]